MKIKILFVFLVCVMALAFLPACTVNLPNQVDQTDSIPVPTVTPGGQGQMGEKPGEPTITPIAAEEVVYAFLTTYEENPDEMIPFLSEALRENMPEGGVLELLDFGGTLEGLVFISGTRLEPSKAVVEAMLQVDGEQLQRKFYLELQGERWLITVIEKQ